MSDNLTIEPGFIGRLNTNLLGNHEGRSYTLQAGDLVEVMRTKPTIRVLLLGGSGARMEPPVTADNVSPDALEPDPGVVVWDAADELAANRQGWCISEVTGGSGHEPFEMQRVDEDGRFAGDPEAWLFVWRGAVERGDPLARRALAFLRARVPVEYEAIRSHCLEHADDD